RTRPGLMAEDHAAGSRRIPQDGQGRGREGHGEGCRQRPLPAADPELHGARGGEAACPVSGAYCQGPDGRPARRCRAWRRSARRPRTRAAARPPLEDDVSRARLALVTSTVVAAMLVTTALRADPGDLPAHDSATCRQLRERMDEGSSAPGLANLVRA